MMSVSRLPLWVQYAQALGPPVVALVAAAIVSVIQYRQWKTAHEKLRYEMFERRYEYFLAIRELMIAAVRNADIADEEIKAFYGKLTGHEFFFGDDVCKFISQTRQKVFDVVGANDLLRNNWETDKRQEMIQKKWDALRSFANDLPKLPEVFSSYLTFARR